MKIPVISDVMHAIGLEKKAPVRQSTYEELMWEATREFNIARQGMENNENKELIEYYIYMYKAAQSRLSYAIKMCRESMGEEENSNIQKISG